MHKFYTFRCNTGSIVVVEASSRQEAMTKLRQIGSFEDFKIILCEKSNLTISEYGLIQHKKNLRKKNDKTT